MKPSKITHVVAKTNRFICPPGYLTVNSYSNKT